MSEVSERKRDMSGRIICSESCGAQVAGNDNKDSSCSSGQRKRGKDAGRPDLSMVLLSLQSSAKADLPDLSLEKASAALQNSR